MKLPQTWGTIVARTLTDPVWFFVTDWFPIYLVAKGIELRSGLIAVWIPFVAADAGNFFSGWLSGYLVRRGWSLGAARKALVIFGGIGVTLLIPTIFTTNLYWLAFLFGLATFAYALLLDHGERAALGPLPQRLGGFGQRDGRRGGGDRHHRRL